MLILVMVLGVLMGVVFPIFDAACHGPYATWFNRDCQRRVDEAGLIGRPERDIISILGCPTFHYAGDDDSQTTYNYAPWPLFPTAKFQVHCHNGIVTGVEQFDD
jgi:hypothetical protein